LITERTTCRLCDSKVSPVFSFTSTPIANDYKSEPDTNADRYPLELTQCTECGHVQQRFVLTELFEDYKYSTPATVARYLDPTAKLLKKRFPKAKTVLEIGSNNGTYLKVLRENGFKATGIDPAASGEGNCKAYFSEGWGFEYASLFHKVDLVIANNVLAHIDDLQDVFRGIDHLLAKDGALVFEVQYLPDLIESGSFDMIYHEHMSYHTVQPLKRFLRRFGLILTNVDHIPLHGGSIRITAQRRGEESRWIDSPPDWVQFFGKVHDVRERIVEKLRGRKVVAFGAAAKATTLIHYCGIASNIIYCVDDTPEKQNKYIPGTDIKILPTSEVKDGEPLFMLAWNYEKEIREKFPTSELIHPFK
jgi:novobiocin biosynthesis protein NovU/D-mycarose 3-C-methyltransferase